MLNSVLGISQEGNDEKTQEISKGLKLQKVMITYICNLLVTPEQKEKLHTLFTSLDENSDGKLCFKELSKGYKKIFGNNSMSLNQLKELFNALDTDKSGTIDYAEFIAAAIDASQFLTYNKLDNIFKIIDQDKSGSVTIQELYKVLNVLKDGSEPFINQLIIEAEADQLQTIPYHDFLKMFLQQASQRSKIPREIFQKIFSETDQIENKRSFRSKKQILPADVKIINVKK